MMTGKKGVKRTDSICDSTADKPSHCGADVEEGHEVEGKVGWDADGDSADVDVSYQLGVVDGNQVVSDVVFL